MPFQFFSLMSLQLTLPLNFSWWNYTERIAHLLISYSILYIMNLYTTSDYIRVFRPIYYDDLRSFLPNKVGLLIGHWTKVGDQMLKRVLCFWDRTMLPECHFPTIKTNFITDYHYFTNYILSKLRKIFKKA